MLEKIVNALRPLGTIIRNGLAYGAFMILPFILPACSNKKADALYIPTNSPPSLAALADLVANECDLIDVLPLINASDPDNNPLTFNFSSPLDSNGRWQTTYTDAGTYPASVTVSDGQGGEDTKNFTITVNDVNRAPVLNPITTPITVNENDLATITASASDPDNDPLNFTITNDAGTNFGLTNPFPWQTDYFSAGTYNNVDVTVSDGKGGTDSQLVQIIVNNVNRAPVLSNIADIVDREGNLITISPSANDPDGDPVTFSFTSPFDSSGQWQTGYSDSGVQTITVTVNDGNGGTDFQNVQVTVKDSKIALARFNTAWQIWAMDPDGNNQTQLTNTVQSNITPSWSPDGSQLVYSSYVGANPNIFKMNADGSNPTQLTTTSNSDDYAMFSPDGSKIVFHSDRNNPGWSDIFVMNADGSGQTALTTSNDSYYPHWSPDGSKIVHCRWQSNNFEVYIMNANGSNPTQLTSNSVNDRFPKWSPDGSKIVYESNGEIWVMNADGSSPTNLTNHTAFDDKPCWSPSGNKICFRSNRDQPTYELYDMSSTGTNVTRLTLNTSTDDNPSWK